MPQGEGQSDWQRRQAEQRREDERHAREQAKLAKEQYLASQQQTADDGTADLDRQVRVLDRLLTDSLPRSPLTVQQLKVSASISRFDPGLWVLLLPSQSGLNMRPPSPRASAGCLADQPGMSVR
jgi:hypothetical protein